MNASTSQITKALTPGIGISARSVARRLKVLNDPKDRELIWFIQWQSQHESLACLADTLLAQFRHRLGTREMVRVQKDGGRKYGAEAIRMIRREMPGAIGCNFPLKGESQLDTIRLEGGFALQGARLSRQAAQRRYLDGLTAEVEEQDGKTPKYPVNYPVESLIEACAKAASEPVHSSPGSQVGTHLQEALARLCLDPTLKLEECVPWYFADLVNVLREYSMQWSNDRAVGCVTSALGRLIEDELEYTLFGRHTMLIEGRDDIGKSHAARTWCERFPGKARFLEITTGNDFIGFVRAIAKELGIEGHLSLTISEITDRVESVLLSGDLLLCLDEAQRLWGETQYSAYPRRIAWIMSLANHKVPLFLISTPQFVDQIKQAKESARWNTGQLLGRIERKELPRELSLEDLSAVSKVMLPESDKETLRAMVAYARKSDGFLGSIEKISRRARYIAQKEGRATTTAEDVRCAMTSGVIPADSGLVKALETPVRSRRARPRPQSRTAAAEQLQPTGRAPAGHVQESSQEQDFADRPSARTQPMRGKSPSLQKA